VIVQKLYPVTESARGSIEEYNEIVPVENLMGVHLDYALALLMPFDIVILEHIGGLRPVCVQVETKSEKRSWSPSSNEEHAREVLNQFGLPVDQGPSREALEDALRKNTAPAVKIPILASHDVASPYSKQV